MVREFRVYNKGQLLMEGASPLDISNLTPHTTYNLEIATWDGKLESERVPVPQFTTLREQLVQGFVSPYRSTDYLVGTWASKKPLKANDVYMVEVEGTKPFSQNFGFYLGTNLVGYFVPKNTGGNKYTMVFNNTVEGANEFKIYQYPSGTAGQVELTSFNVYKIDVSENLLTEESLQQLPINVNTYNVFTGNLKKKWELGKRYYVRLKGTKLESQSFTVYSDAGRTNKGNMSRIANTNTYELTFTISQWDIDREVDNTVAIYQTPNGAGVGQATIEELVVLETNEAVLPKSIEIIPSTINLKVGESSTSQFKVTPSNAENFLTNFIGWQGGIATNSTADPERGLTARGVAVGNFTATIRSSVDPSVETQVTVNVTA